MYVAITRAEERLWLTRAAERNLYGRRDRTVMSRFLKELSGPLGIKDAPVFGGNRYSGYGYGAQQRYGGDFYADREARGQVERGYSRSLYSEATNTPAPQQRLARALVSGLFFGQACATAAGRQI